MKRPPHPRQCSLARFFLVFLQIGVSSFGSNVAYAHRLLVDDWEWLGSDEFTDIWSICQVLPGPNIINWAIIVGMRFRGAPGAMAAVLGMILMPIVIVMALGLLYSAYGDRPEVHGFLRGIAPVAAGMLTATVARMAMTPRLRSWLAVFPLLAFLAVMAGLPLLMILCALAPLSIAAVWARHAKAKTGP